MEGARLSPAGEAHWPAFAAVLAVTALGWTALFAIGTTGLEAICGGSTAGTALMWGLMAVTMMLPCAIHEIGDAARHGWGAATAYALGCIALPVLLAVGAGAVLGSVVIATPLLLAIAGAALAAEACWSRLADNRLGSAVAMLCLQLVGGAMDLNWMALVAVWMLALALAPARRMVTAAAATALLGFAAFGSL